MPLSPSPADQLSAGVAGEVAILTDHVTAKDLIRKAQKFREVRSEGNDFPQLKIICARNCQRSNWDPERDLFYQFSMSSCF